MCHSRNAHFPHTSRGRCMQASLTSLHANTTCVKLKWIQSLSCINRGAGWPRELLLGQSASLLARRAVPHLTISLKCRTATVQRPSVNVPTGIFQQSTLDHWTHVLRQVTGGKGPSLSRRQAPCTAGTAAGACPFCTCRRPRAHRAPAPPLAGPPCRWGRCWRGP